MNEVAVIGGVVAFLVILLIFVAAGWISAEDAGVIVGATVQGLAEAYQEPTVHEPWMALQYSYDPDPDTPYGLKKKTDLFDIRPSDISVTRESEFEQVTLYSDYQNTVSQQIAASFSVGAYYGAFSGDVSMTVSRSADSSIRTARFDQMLRNKQQSVMGSGTFHANPHTKIKTELQSFIRSSSAQEIADTLGSFYATSAKLGGVVHKSTTVQVQSTDTRSSLEAELEVGVNFGFGLGISSSFGARTSTRTTTSHAEMRTALFAAGGDADRWLDISRSGNNFNEIKDDWVASFSNENLFVFDHQLVPIWELVNEIDRRKGSQLESYLRTKWDRQSNAFTPTTWYGSGSSSSSRRRSSSSRRRSSPPPPTPSPPSSSCSAMTTITITSASSTRSISDGSGSYQNDESCVWRLTCPSSRDVRISFSSFSTEANYDFVNIYNNQDSWSTSAYDRVFQHSGASTPSRVTSSGRYAVLEFVTDGSSTHGGFSATFSCAVRASTSATCHYTNDGECDQPGRGGTGVCAAGTDTADCDSCRYANDGECDHGTFCSTGTDWSDCAPGLG